MIAISQGTGGNDYKYPVITYICYSYSVVGLA